MGGSCSRPSTIAVQDSPPRERLSSKRSSGLRGVSRENSRRDEGVRVKDKVDRAEAKISLIDRKANGSSRRLQVDKKKIKDKIEVDGANFPAITKLPKAVEGEQIAAGWPTWLVSVAGEAIKGWIPRRADTFEKLDKIGQGTYSNVYKARDTIDGKMVALKRVRFDNLDPESVKFMAREILVLRRLDHPNIIKLHGLITSRMSCSLYLVFEYMEHDLTGLASLPGIKFTEPQVKCYMQQLLSGLDHCHSRGVLHRDVKGSNLLIDNNGILKIADFGLASFFDPHHDYPMTSRVVTLWYRPPELLLGSIQYGVAVDLWSAGCILGELYAGRPIMPGRTEVEQLHKIFKLCGSPSEDFWRKSNLPHAKVFKPQQPYKRCVADTFKDFPSAAIGLMETLLSIDPANRGTAARALKSEFFTSDPLACDPSSLPQYPPSKEIDAKMREEESKRQRAERGRGPGDELERKRPNGSRAAPVPNANTESAISTQNQQGHSNSKGQSETFNPWKDEVVSDFPVDPSRQSQAANEMSKDLLENHRRASYSGPLVQGAGRVKPGKKHDSSMVSARPDLSNLSGLVATRTLLSDDRREKPGPSQPKATNRLERFSGPLNEWESTIKRDQKRHSQRIPSVHQEDGKAYARDREPIMNGHGSMGNKIGFSGPLVPSVDVDQMLREHDRHLQEFARKTRLDKARQARVHAQGSH